MSLQNALETYLIDSFNFSPSSNSSFPRFREIYKGIEKLTSPKSKKKDHYTGVMDRNLFD
jgi:hypothetical protein